MQILWNKYKSNNFEANLDECGIEQGTPGAGYNYKVEKNAVIHYISKGSGTFKIYARSISSRPNCSNTASLNFSI